MISLQELTRITGLPASTILRLAPVEYCLGNPPWTSLRDDARDWAVAYLREHGRGPIHAPLERRMTRPDSVPLPNGQQFLLRRVGT